MLNLKVIIGSTRPGRAAEQVIPWFTAQAREHGAFDVDVLDLRDWPLPIFAETFATVGDPRNPTFSAPVVRRWNDKIAEGDSVPGHRGRPARPARRPTPADRLRSVQRPLGPSHLL